MKPKSKEWYENAIAKRIAMKTERDYGVTLYLGLGRLGIDEYMGDVTYRGTYIKPVYVISVINTFSLLSVCVSNWSRGELYIHYSYNNSDFRTIKGTLSYRWSNFFQAVTIQRTWLRCISDPTFKMCRRRLEREFLSYSP